MFKVGDRYYCIKDRKYHNNNININKAGEIYKISSLIENNWIALNSELTIDFFGEFMYSLKYDNAHCYFYDYFISLKEYRKQKLQKICSSQEIK